MNLLDKVSKTVEASLIKYSQGEDAEYAISLTVLPGNQVGQFVPALITVITLPGIVIGEKAQSVSINFNLALPEEQIDKLVSESVEGLRAERSKALSEIPKENPFSS
jgi:hypothetical protein